VFRQKLQKIETGTCKNAMHLITANLQENELREIEWLAIKGTENLDILNLANNEPK
jgi:hypothetical protein